MLFKRVNLSLAGSGQLYVGYVGVLWCLVDKGIEIVEISGTSGGAVIAAGIGSGYKPGASMVQLACETLPYRNGLFDPSWSAIKRWGFMGGDRIESKFKELYCPNIGATSLPIHVTTSNVTQETGTIWSSKHTPAASLSRIVRASVSLPFVFTPVPINGDLHVDGGLTYNHPTNVFENDLPVLSVSFGSQVGPIKKFFNYLGSLSNTTVNANGSQRETNIKKLRIEMGYQGFNYFIGDDDVKVMVEKAYNATEVWLRENEDEFWQVRSL